MERNPDHVSPVNLDAVTATIVAEMDGRTVTTYRGDRLYVEKATNPGYSGSWLTVTDPTGKVSHVYVGIGR